MSDYITKSTVKEDYGLTDGMIKQLGEPDKTAPNPHYRSSAPMQLYLRSRVEQWVADHAEAVAKVLARRKARPPKPEREDVDYLAIYYSQERREEPEYRKTVRQVGEKWSWGVYQVAPTQIVNVGWANSKAEADAICQKIIQAEEKLWRLDREERYSRY